MRCYGAAVAPMIAAPLASLVGWRSYAGCFWVVCANGGLYCRVLRFVHGWSVGGRMLVDWLSFTCVCMC